MEIVWKNVLEDRRISYCGIDGIFGVYFFVLLWIRYMNRMLRYK